MWYLAFWAVYLAQHNNLQFHSFSFKWHFILHYGWVIWQGIYTMFSLPIHWMLGSLLPV
jgi:hypothetical protein